MDQSVVPFVFLGLIAFAFWLLVLRPAKQRAKAQEAVVSSIAPGERVLMASGMIGTVVSREGGEIQLEVAPGTVVSFVEQAVLRRLDPVGTDGADNSSAPREDDERASGQATD